MPLGKLTAVSPLGLSRAGRGLDRGQFHGWYPKVPPLGDYKLGNLLERLRIITYYWCREGESNPHDLAVAGF